MVYDRFNQLRSILRRRHPLSDILPRNCLNGITPLQVLHSLRAAWRPPGAKPRPMVPSSSPDAPRFTPKQGQYLAFIYAYTRVMGRPPAEADMQRHFGVSPPTVHQMILTLERAGLIRRRPGVARSIEVLIAPESLPILR